MTAKANPLRAYAAVTAAYWAFMLSDGALRMLVLLHFNTLGFTPVQLAWLFLLYEVAGIVTNLARRVAGRALRAGGNALRRAKFADRGVGGAGAARPELDNHAIGHFCYAGARRIGRGERPVQDVLKIGGQAAGPV